MARSLVPRLSPSVLREFALKYVFNRAQLTCSTSFFTLNGETTSMEMNEQWMRRGVRAPWRKFPSFSITAAQTLEPPDSLTSATKKYVARAFVLNRRETFSCAGNPTVVVPNFSTAKFLPPFTSSLLSFHPSESLSTSTNSPTVTRVCTKSDF